MVRNGDGGLWSWWEGLDRETEVVEREGKDGGDRLGGDRLQRWGEGKAGRKSQPIVQGSKIQIQGPTATM